MRCRKARKLISLYVVPGESSLNSEERQALDTHMSVCKACRLDCEESRAAVSVLRSCWQISDDTAALLRQEHRRESRGGVARVVRLPRGTRRVAGWAVAACLAVGVLGSWVVLKETEAPAGRNGAAARGSDGGPLVVETGDGSRIASDAVIQTSSKETMSLVLNGRHQVEVNRESRLSVSPLVEAGRTGILVDLVLGEVYVHVEHDGNPFVVQTAHGCAVITGTTFDVKTAEAGMTLVVVEGSVRFESGGQAVQVIAGQRSVISAASASPSAPESCDVTTLTAWADGSKRTPQVAQSVRAEDLLLDDLPLPSWPWRQVKTDLDSIDYALWGEQERDWFKREFPDVFRLQEALAKDGVEVDYPDLLLESGAVWAFAWPPATRGRFLPLRDVTIINAAAPYGKDGQWLEDKGLLDNAHAPTADRTFGFEAFVLWQKEVAAVLEADGPVRLELLSGSLRACDYLRHTRSLIWLAVDLDRHSLPDVPASRLQDWLRQDMAAIDRCTNACLRLLTAEKASVSCESDPYRQLVRDLFDAVAQIGEAEGAVSM